MTVDVMPFGDPLSHSLFSQIWFVNDSTIVCLSFWNLLSWLFNPFFFGANYSLTYARQQKRHKCIERTFGLWGRGRGWDDLGEWHWNVYYYVRNESPVYVWYRIQDAWGWCTRITQRDGMGREMGEVFRSGNLCTPVADSCWCMANQYNIVKEK